MPQENDLLQKFINNEKRNKQTTLLFTIIFVLAALSVLYMANRLKKKTLVIANQEQIIDSLNNILAQKFENSNTALKQNSDSLRLQNEILVNKIEQIHAKIGQTMTTTERNLLQQEVKQVHLNSARIANPKKSYTVYIQYNDEAHTETAQISTLRTRLTDLGFRVPKEEYINDELAQTEVRFFHEEDEKFAEEVLLQVRKTYSKAKLVKALKVKSPKQQIEIWLKTKQ